MASRELFWTANKGHAFQKWRDRICDQLIGVNLEGLQSSEFRGEFLTMPIGGNSLAQVAAPPTRVFRPSEMADREEHPAWLVNMLLKGSAVSTQGSNQFVIKPGDIFIHNNLQPYSMELETDFQIVTLRVPADAMARYMTVSEGMCSIPLRRAGRGAEIAGALFRSLHENITYLDRIDAELAIGAMLTMVSAACAPLGGGSRTANHASFTRICQLIECNLADPELRPAAIAEMTGLSARQLNRLFEAEGQTISRLILRRRLERCRLDLISRGLSHRTVGEIAFGWGFNNLSHFSESFRNAYGVTPRQMRLSGYSGRKIAEHA